MGVGKVITWDRDQGVLSSNKLCFTITVASNYSKLGPLSI